MASKLALMQARTDEYIQLSVADPATYPITVERIADFVPVARRLFYKTDPETRALLARIDEAKRVHRATSGAATAGDRPPTVGPTATTAEGMLSDEQLAREIGQVVSQTGWVMQRYVAQRKRAPGSEEAPLALYDLEQAVAALHGHIARLTPLVREQQRRRKRPRQGPDGAVGAA